MKNPKEYLKELFEEPFNLEEGSIEDDFLQVVKYIQIDTIKETVQACADNADADYTITDNFDPVTGEDIEVYVIKSSILEVANKLIKELK